MRRLVPPIRICATRNLWSSLIIIAQERKLFAANGLDVSIEFTESAKMALDRLLAGQVHLSTVVPIDLATISPGHDEGYRVVATICVAANNAIVANRSAGIRGGADLKGKRLGVFAGTSSSVFAERVIGQHGLGRDDVRLIPLERRRIETALLANEVDAVSVWEPLTSRIVAGLNKDGSTVIIDPDYRGFMNLCVRGDWQVANEDALILLLDAVRKAERFTRRQCAFAQRILAARIGMDLEMVVGLWKSFNLHLHLDVTQLKSAIAEEGSANSEVLATSTVVLDPRPLERSVSYCSG